LCAQGRFQEALRAAGKALKDSPDDARLWNVAGAAALSLNLPGDAERFWTVAISKAGDYAEPQFNLAQLQLRQGKLDRAARSLARVLTLEPDHALALTNLGAILLEFDQVERAMVLLQRAIGVNSANAQAHNNLGLAQMELGQLEEARVSLDRAIALQPNFAEVLNSLSILSMETGDHDAAAKYIDAAIIKDPNNGRAHMNRALMTTAIAGAAWIDRLERAHANRASTTPRSASALCFAMGKVREELGDYSAAFDAYLEANRRHYVGHPFDGARDEQWVRTLIATFTADLYLNAPAARVAQRNVPIFVIGMPRSGTTLIEQILDSHPLIRGAGELPVLANLAGQVPVAAPARENRAEWLDTLRALGRDYFARVWGPGIAERYVVDKMPDNYRYAGLIPLMFSYARIIHVTRDPMDTCLSCFVTPFRRGHEYSYDLAMLGGRYQRYRRLMDHWSAVLPSDYVLQVRYEDLVVDVESEARRMLSYVGLPWDERCLQFYENRRTVRTASVTQVRERAHTRSISRWKRFEHQLEPLWRSISVIATAELPGSSRIR